jgi:hypothetical protein
MKHVPLGLLLLVLAASAAHLACYAPQLPPRGAVHFGAAGRPDGWSTRGSFVATHAGLVAFMAAIFLLMGKIVDWVPARLVNLPHREFWLDPARRPVTRACLASWGHAFGALTLAFFLTIAHMVVRVNLGRDPALHPAFLGCLLGYLAAAVVFTVWLWRRFAHLPPGADAAR